MRGWRLGVGAFVLCALISVGLCQEEPPLINYATLHGEFDYDYYFGNPSVGLVRDGVAEGFSATIPENFTFELDEVDKVSGLAAQKISFNRNSAQPAEAVMRMDMYFPSDDYPQPGQTVLITIWVKTESWNNASIRIRARGLDGSGGVNLYNSPDEIPVWTQLRFNYTVPNSTPRGIALELWVRANAGVASGTVRFDKLETTGNKRWRPHRPRALKIIAPYYPWATENQRDWVYYSREFDAMICDWPYIKALRTHRPDLRNVLYYNLIYSYRTDSNTRWGERDIFGYWYADRYHPDWFLINVFGSRQQFGSRLYMMDIGNPTVSNWAAQNLDLYMRYSDSGRDTIHFDSFIDFFFPGFLLQRYPTSASRMAAMHKHLLNMRRVLDDRSIQFIVNAAGEPYTRDRPHTYFMRQGLLDGMLVEEAFTYIFGFPFTGFVSFNLWEQQVNTLVENRPRLRVVYSGYSVSNPVVGRQQKIYALASFLLCADDNIYLYLDKHYYDGPPSGQRSWRPDADFDVPLGQPTGGIQVLFRSSDYRGGLYYRPFQNGFVLVNPTGNIAPRYKDGAIFTYVLDADYRELWSGQLFPAGSRIKLYPKEARIFYRESSGLHTPPSDGSGRTPDLPGGDGGKILPSGDPIRIR